MGSIRLRTYLLALLLIPLNIYWLLSLQIERNQGYASMLSLFFNVVFVLFLLILANRILIEVAPRQALSQSELPIARLLVSLLPGAPGADAPAPRAAGAPARGAADRRPRRG